MPPEHRTTIDSSRFDRIEDKLDKLSEAIVQLARFEEKLIVLEKTNQSLTEHIMTNDRRWTEISSELLKVKAVAEDAESTIKNIRKIFWIGISSAAATVGTWWVAVKTGAPPHVSSGH